MATIEHDNGVIPFWREKTLEEMNPDEWESLCDGCARCCLLQLVDEETGALAVTGVACALLDPQSCTCGDYEKREFKVIGCLRLTPELVRSLDWLPVTCAYRLLAEGHDLPAWHPLVSGDPQSVHNAGISVQGKTVSENDIDPEDLGDWIISSDTEEKP